MLFQVENTSHGYVVSCYYDMHWCPLRNFGDRQGDAIDFKIYDCPRLEDNIIRALIKRYDADVRYSRLCPGRFKKEQ